jgi:hypothetical protein
LLGKKGLGETGKTYAFENAVEIVFGRNEDEQFESFDTKRGRDLEPFAFNKLKEWKEFEFMQVEKCSFFPLGENAGASPDGFVGNDELLEIKCPSASTHLEYLRNNCLPAKYIPQVQGQLWITGKRKAHFVSYHPDLKPLIICVERDEVFIDRLQSEVIKAVDKINQLVKEFSL